VAAVLTRRLPSIGRGEIESTQESIGLFSLLGQMNFSQADTGEDTKGDGLK